MKKIEAIVREQSFADLKAKLSKAGSYIVAKQAVSDNDIYERQAGPSLGGTGIKSIPLVKLELVVPDVDAKKVIQIISASSGIKLPGGKIFVSEMMEVVDMITLEGEKETDAEPSRRSRLVPLQKYTLAKVEWFYEQNKTSLQNDYKIKSFSDFVNYCVLQQMDVLEERLNRHSSVYDLRSF
ncbi:MAG: P-II family nitrogen regulator [Candidatus Nitrosotenuis sp.]